MERHSYPIGEPVDSYHASHPAPIVLTGRYVTLTPLNPAEHADPLWRLSSGETNKYLWDYLSDGPYTTAGDFQAAIERKAWANDALFFAVIDGDSGQAVGYASYMRIEPQHGCLEVGNILFTPALQRTRGATEAMYLMARHVFEDLGYRRYEWKCNALNALSRRAALRLGFQFEGIFRQHMIVKGRNRDTAWFSMLDSEWPLRKANFERWLDPSNFDRNGQQIGSLSALNGR
jgi:RimJ/RimL family protein N-acetyltransferase